MKKILIMLLACLMALSMIACEQTQAAQVSYNMDINAIIPYITALMLVIGALVILTNIIVEVLKNFLCLYPH